MYGQNAYKCYLFPRINQFVFIFTLHHPTFLTFFQGGLQVSNMYATPKHVQI